VLLVGNVLGVGRDAKVGKNLGHGLLILNFSGKKV
jgi:hypothetical protein